MWFLCVFWLLLQKKKKKNSRLKPLIMKQYSTFRNVTEKKIGN